MEVPSGDGLNGLGDGPIFLRIFAGPFAIACQKSPMLCRGKKVSLLLLAALAVTLYEVPPVQADPAIRAQLLRSTGWVAVPKGEEYLYGSCWLLDADQRLVITSQHLVAEAQQLWVYFPIWDKGEVLLQSLDYLRNKAHILGRVKVRDIKRDLALIQLERLPAGLRPLPLADKYPRLGQKVYSLGNADMANCPIHAGRLWKFREGSVCRAAFAVWTLSVTGERVEARTVDATSGAAPGDSGGPLVDEQGQLLGVVSSCEGNCGKCIAVSEIKTFLKKARDGAKAKKSPLEGCWTVVYKNPEGCDYCFSLTFGPQGQVLWEGERDFAGRYSCNQDVLHVDIPGLDMRENWTLHWDQGTRFTFTRGDTLHTCSRR